MLKIISLLVLGLVAAGAQETKGDSATKTNTPIRVSANEAKEHIGSQAVVKGKIAEINVGERVIRLNFEQSFPKNPFTAVIFPVNTNKFPEVEKLKSKTVEISGKIAAYREKPQIILTSTNQLKVLEEPKEAVEKK
jgi:DNA/RNA endonuclease YhcR with UshA esterase domain